MISMLSLRYPYMFCMLPTWSLPVPRLTVPYLVTTWSLPCLYMVLSGPYLVLIWSRHGLYCHYMVLAWFLYDLPCHNMVLPSPDFYMVHI